MNRLRIHINPGADFEALRARFAPGEMGRKISGAIVTALDRANPIVLSRIKRSRFTGNGPFDVALHKLGHRSRTLIRELTHSPAGIANAETLAVASGLGTNLKYFGVHEFGFDGNVDVPAHRREMPETIRTTRNGRKYTVPPHTQSVRAHKRRLKVTARAPMLTGLQEEQNQETYKDELFTAISDVMRG